MQNERHMQMKKSLEKLGVGLKRVEKSEKRYVLQRTMVESRLQELEVEAKKPKDEIETLTNTEVLSCKT